MRPTMFAWPTRRRATKSILFFSLQVFAVTSVVAQTPGVTPTEIRVGQTIAYSGPASAYGQLGKAEAAYFEALNAKGGINGRKINFISRDDGAVPSKAVENTRKLVEEDEVAIMFGMLGTALNIAIRPYLNGKKVPQLFIAAAASTFNEPKKYPWTMSWQPNLQIEGQFYGKTVLQRTPQAKIGVLYQNDDFGKDLLSGLREGLGERAPAMIVGEQSFQSTDPSIDSQIVLLRNAGADVVMLFTFPKQGAQAIAKIASMGWKPERYLHLGAASIGATFKPAGLEASAGVLTAGVLKDVSDEKWKDDTGVKEWRAWKDRYMPAADPSDLYVVAGYAYAQTLEQVLNQAGSDLSRENIMRQAANLKDFRPELLLPGVTINTSPDDYRVVKAVKLQRFNGASWDFPE